MVRGTARSSDLTLILVLGAYLMLWGLLWVILFCVVSIATRIRGMQSSAQGIRMPLIIKSSALHTLNTQEGHALSYSLAHLAVPYGDQHDAHLEPKYIREVALIDASPGAW
jgi:hypothetical protein